MKKLSIQAKIWIQVIILFIINILIILFWCSTLYKATPSIVKSIKKEYKLIDSLVKDGDSIKTNNERIK